MAPSCAVAAMPPAPASSPLAPALASSAGTDAAAAAAAAAGLATSPFLSPSDSSDRGRSRQPPRTRRSGDVGAAASAPRVPKEEEEEKAAARPAWREARAEARPRVAPDHDAPETEVAAAAAPCILRAAFSRLVAAAAGDRA